MSVIFLCMVTVCTLVVTVECGDFIPDRKCAALRSEQSFQGDKFVIKDFDRTVNTRNDYRSSVNGWENTSSIQIQDNCQLKICDKPYFQGNCAMFSDDITTPISLIPQVLSAECTCVRECRCEDISIAKDENGRAYLSGGCNTCNSEYISIHRRDPTFSFEHRNLVTALVLRNGCHVTVYREAGFKGESMLISTPIHENFQGTLGSYQVTCIDIEQDSRKQDPATSVPQPIQLPETVEGFSQILAGNGSLTSLPGFLAAFQSMKSGRSWKNAYILIIGSHLPDEIGVRCRSVTKSVHGISECSLSVSLDEMGISSAELRVIVVHPAIGYQSDFIRGADSDPSDDSRIIASLDDYLSQHEDLKEAIPNAVIIHHKITDREFASEGSHFHRKVDALRALGGRILDQNRSNVIFLLDNMDDLPFDLQNNPEPKLKEYRMVIKDKWSLPAPICIATTHQFFWSPVKVNGFFKLGNGDYWPLNLRNYLLQICELSGDALGYAIIKAAYQKDLVLSQEFNVKKELLPENHQLVDHYRDCLTNASATTCSNVTEKAAMRVETLNIAIIPSTTAEPILIKNSGNSSCSSKYVAMQHSLSQVHQQLVEHTDTSQTRSDLMQSKLDRAEERLKQLEERIANLELQMEPNTPNAIDVIEYH